MTHHRRWQVAWWWKAMYFLTCSLPAAELACVRLTTALATRCPQDRRALQKMCVFFSSSSSCTSSQFLFRWWLGVWIVSFKPEMLTLTVGWSSFPLTGLIRKRSTWFFTQHHGENQIHDMATGLGHIGHNVWQLQSSLNYHIIREHYGGFIVYDIRGKIIFLRFNVALLYLQSWFD